jgi:probable F420-dependent oxidoreductase
MKIGLFGMNMRPCVTPEAIAAAAQAAEESGCESFWGGEHIVQADPQTPDSPMPPKTEFIDLAMAMAFAAAHTRRLRFGTGIIILPLRNPVVLAKQLASVDVVSGGRLICGFGIGNLAFEFAAVRMPFDHKGRRAEEAIRAMRALWSGGDFQGKYFNIKGVKAEPRPVRGAAMPIVFGGKSVYAFGRTARLGDGWYGYGIDLEASRSCINGLRAACARHGRNFAEIEISITPKAAADRDLIQRYEDLGVGRIVLAPRARTIAEMIEAIKRSEELTGRASE